MVVLLHEHGFEEPDIALFVVDDQNFLFPNHPNPRTTLIIEYMSA